MFFFYIWKNHFIIKELKKEYLLRLLILVLAGLSLAGLKTACNYYVNGLHRAERLAAIQEKLAEPTYKPSTELHKKHMYLYMKARGNSLERRLEVIDQGRRLGGDDELGASGRGMHEFR